MPHNSSPIKIKIQLYCGEEIAMGPGKADLLDAIALHGSISAAGRAMQMSYRRAWMLVDTLNRCWQASIVETAPGSAHGGGAKLTPLGRDVLRHYRQLQACLVGASHGPDYAALVSLMRTEPKPSQKN
jgi:molybdate transport system regulatory protein